MGLVDKCSHRTCQVLLGVALACLFAIALAMTLAPPDSEIFADYNPEEINSGDQSWLLIASAMVLLMTPGIAFFYGGMINSKNVVATIASAILPMALVPICWAVLGFSISFGEDLGGIIGNPASYGLMYHVGAAPWPGLTVTTSLWFLFQCMFAIVTPAVLLGSISDRVNFSALTIFIPLWHLIVYCPICHMVWTSDGIIAAWGILDFAGGMVVHMSAGYSALAAAYFLGPAKDKPQEPASVPFIVIGTALLWFSWFGFNAGSAFGANASAAHAFVNTNTATAFSMVTWTILDKMHGNQFKTTGLCLGIIVGLVVITPGAGLINVGAAAIFGIVGALCCWTVTYLMEHYGRKVADDTLDVFACHGFGGSVGTTLTALFQNPQAGAGHPGAFYGNWSELGKSIAVQILLILWYLLATYALIWFTNLFITFRVTAEEEIQGLDKSKHGERANGIKVTIE